MDHDNHHRNVMTMDRTLHDLQYTYAGLKDERGAYDGPRQPPKKRHDDGQGAEKSAVYCVLLHAGDEERENAHPLHSNKDGCKLSRFRTRSNTTP
jgi:hypothetical protein